MCVQLVNHIINADNSFLIMTLLMGAALKQKNLIRPVNNQTEVFLKLCLCLCAGRDGNGVSTHGA